MSDDQLLEDFISHRDEDAFAAIVRRYGPMVLRVSRDILGNSEDAKDAFQATFVALLQQAGSIRQRASLGRWLYKVACRISRRENCRIARMRAQEGQLPALGAQAPPDSRAMDREFDFILHDEIGRLPAKLHDPIVLCYFEGLTVEDAARRLCCPVGTLKSRLGIGRELLRSRLTRRGLAVSALLPLGFSPTPEGSAALPALLVDSTVSAAMKGAGVSKRVFSMVFEQKAVRRRARIVLSWSLVLAPVMSFELLGLASSRLVYAVMATASAIFKAEPLDSPKALAPAQSASMPQVEGGEHCRAR
jgi:RNA polymerase sigma factor (sigma-70 family)